MTDRSVRLPRIDLVMVVLVLAALVGGILIGVVGPWATLPYFAVASVFVSFFVSHTVLLILTWMTAAVFAGVVEYFVGINQGFWLAYLLGLLLALRAVVSGPMAHRSNSMDSISSSAERASGGLLPWLCIAWLIVATFSTIVALPGLGQVIVALKNYYFMWGVLLAVVWLRWSESALRSAWTAVVAVAVCQWPFALYQRVFVATKRGDAAYWDAVVGTFGGDPGGGGHSAAMALVACVGLLVIISRWRAREMGTGMTLMLGAMCLASVMLAEVKMIFVWLPVVAVLLFLRDIRSNPPKALLLFCLAAVMIGGMAAGYREAFYKGPRMHTWGQFFDSQIRYAVDPEEFNVAHRRLGRIAALSFWWQRNSIDDPVQFLFGHGLGASRGSSIVAVGELARRYPYQIDFSSVSALLWDTGLVGAGLFLALIGVGAWTGLSRAIRDGPATRRRQLSFMSGGTLLLIGMGAIYNRDAVNTPAIQILLFFAVGQILRLSRSDNLDKSD